MRIVITIVALIAIFVAGIIIGKGIGYRNAPSPYDKKETRVEQDDRIIQNKVPDKSTRDNDSYNAELAELKEHLAQEQKARQIAEEKLKVSREGKIKDKEDKIMSRFNKRALNHRLREVEKKIPLSLSQKDSITNEMKEMHEQIAIKENSSENWDEIMENEYRLFDEKLKGMLNYQQYQAYQETVEKERGEEIDRMIETYIIQDALGFLKSSEEQKTQIKTVFKPDCERINPVKDPMLGYGVKVYQDKDILKMIRHILTEEQIKIFEDHIKEQEEYEKEEE